MTRWMEMVECSRLTRLSSGGARVGGGSSYAGEKSLLVYQWCCFRHPRKVACGASSMACWLKMMTVLDWKERRKSSTLDFASTLPPLPAPSHGP